VERTTTQEKKYCVDMAFQESTARLYVHLHPSCLEDPAAALEHELNGKLMRYDEVLKGIVLSYDQVKVEDSRVRIFNDSHFLNVRVSVRWLLFCPQPGMKLVGEVNYATSTGLGLLVHGIFNASIQDANLPEGWEFYEDDNDDQAYWESGDHKIKIGTLVAFEVTDCRNTDDILSIRGSALDEDKYGVVGQAEVPFAERHRLDASATAAVLDIHTPAKTDATTPGKDATTPGKSPTASGKGSAKKRKAEDDKSPSEGTGSSTKPKKKSKKATPADEEVDAEENGKIAEAKSAKKEKKSKGKKEKGADATPEKKNKKEKKDKKDKKEKKEEKGG